VRAVCSGIAAVKMSDELLMIRPSAQKTCATPFLAVTDG